MSSQIPLRSRYPLRQSTPQVPELKQLLAPFGSVGHSRHRCPHVARIRRQAIDVGADGVIDELIIETYDRNDAPLTWFDDRGVDGSYDRATYFFNDQQGRRLGWESDDDGRRCGRTRNARRTLRGSVQLVPPNAKLLTAKCAGSAKPTCHPGNAGSCDNERFDQSIPPSTKWRGAARACTATAQSTKLP